MQSATTRRTRHTSSPTRESTWDMVVPLKSTWNTVSRVRSSVSSLGWSTARQPWVCTSRLGTAAASTPAPQDRDSLVKGTIYTITMVLPFTPSTPSPCGQAPPPPLAAGVRHRVVFPAEVLLPVLEAGVEEVGAAAGELPLEAGEVAGGPHLSQDTLKAESVMYLSVMEAVRRPRKVCCRITLCSSKQPKVEAAATTQELARTTTRAMERLLLMTPRRKTLLVAMVAAHTRLLSPLA